MSHSLDRHKTMLRRTPRLTPAAIILAASVLTVLSLPPQPVQAQSPEVKAAIQRGVSFLRRQMKLYKNVEGGGRPVLAAYAMVKAGVPPTDPVVAKVLEAVKKKTRGGKYHPGGDIIYTTGCELMLLEAAEKRPGQYRREMQTIVDFVVKKQHPSGYWNYLGGDKEGDTSVTQYGVLGLWAAERAGIDVPPSAWDKVAAWLISNQQKDGGFAYRPAKAGESSTDSMTVAGVSTLLVARRYLYPNLVARGEQAAKKKKAKPKKTGILEQVDLDEDVSKEDGNGKSKDKSIDYKPNVSFAQLNRALGGGVNWLANRFRVGGGQWPVYTLYGVERLAALANTERIGKVQWYPAGTKYLLRNEKNGKFTSSNRTVGDMPATSFAILFLGRFTGKLLGRAPPEFLGEGLLRGGRGLPDDLSSLSEGDDGKIKRRKISGPLDQLLAELQKPKNLEVPEVQQAIVEKIQLGDRKQWLKPERRKQLLTMIDHPRPDVRKVAVWALGRTGDIDIAGLIMDALENDPDLDVAIEARNALCWLSRKPNGFGLPETPEFPPGADKSEKLRIATEWRREAVRRWKTWYLTVRPYEERDDLTEIKRPE